MRKAKIYIDAGVTEDILHGFLQHVQDFNAQYKDRCHINLSVAAPWMSTEELLSVMQSLVPALPYQKVIPRAAMTEEQKRAMDAFLKEER